MTARLSAELSPAGVALDQGSRRPTVSRRVRESPGGSRRRRTRLWRSSAGSVSSGQHSSRNRLPGAVGEEESGDLLDLLAGGAGIVMRDGRIHAAATWATSSAAKPGRSRSRPRGCSRFALRPTRGRGAISAPSSGARGDRRSSERTPKRWHPGRERRRTRPRGLAAFGDTDTARRMDLRSASAASFAPSPPPWTPPPAPVHARPVAEPGPLTAVGLADFRSPASGALAAGLARAPSPERQNARARG